jgi:hypothetical protein
MSVLARVGGADALGKYEVPPFGDVEAIVGVPESGIGQPASEPFIFVQPEFAIFC